MGYAIKLLVFCSVLISLTSLSGCDKDRIAVVVRPCVMEGSGWASNQNLTGKQLVTNYGLEQLSSAVEKTKSIWENGADISIILPGDVPVISDPVPPGAKIESGATSKYLGDVYQDQGIGSSPSAEVERAVAECNEKWTQIFPNGLPGIPVIFVGQFTRDDAQGDAGLLGFAPTINGSSAICQRPYQIGPTTVAGRFMVIRTNWPPNESGQRAFVGHTMAHEFGHTLLLRHGDGIDNNSDGLWDSGCDASGEAFTDGSEGSPRSLMLISDQASEIITPLQREVARLAAKQYPGTLDNGG